MLETMIQELDYLIDKYSSPEWSSKTTANRVVELVSEHKALIQTELNEVVSGVRKLKDTDFLGPRARARRAVMQDVNKPDNSKYFVELEKQIKKQKDARQMATALRAHKKRQGGVKKARQEVKPHLYPDSARHGTQDIREWREYVLEPRRDTNSDEMY